SDGERARDRRALGGRLRRSRHRAPPPGALRNGRGVGGLLPTAPRPPVQARDAQGARGERPHADPTRPTRHRAALLPLHPARPHARGSTPAEPVAFARELRVLGVPVAYHAYANSHGEWRAQLDTGLTWAFRATCGQFVSTPSCTNHA